MRNSAMKLPPTTQEAEGLPRRRFTVAELEQMTELGILLEDERLELIGGEVVPMSPKGARHEALKMELNELWMRIKPGALRLLQETTFRLSQDTYLEPDFIVWPREAGARPSAAHEIRGLNAETALLAVEIADSSLAYDLGRKASVYARYGVRELWVIDAARLTVRIHLEPDEALGLYRRTANHGADEILTPEFAPALTLRLADLNL
jgi:Uma2 family endonuclease